MILSLLLVACAGRVRPPGPVIREVTVEGVHAIPEDELISHLNMRPTPITSVKGKHYYVPGLEQLDRERVEEVYRARGYHDARVEDIDVTIKTRGDQAIHARRAERRERRGRRPPRPLRRFAYVHLTIDEGLPARVRTLRYTWSAGDPEVDHAELEALAHIHEGDVFSQPEIVKTRGAIVEALERRGYAHAKATAEASVDRDARVADVSIHVEPGQRVTIDSIELEGLDVVPEDLVQRELSFAIGERYSPKLRERVESSIYDMEVFSTVSVKKGPPRGDGAIKLIARVSEAKLQSFKIGGGLGIDPARWEQRLSFRYRHESIFGRLTRMDVLARAGYAELPNFWAPQQHGPIASLDLSFRKKGLLERGLIWTEKPGVDLGIWEGYQYWAIKNSLGVSRFFTRFFKLGLSYNNRYEQLFNLSPALEDPDNQARLGPGFRERYFLSYLEAAATVHLTDSLLTPQNGARLTVYYDFANRYIGSQFNYHKFSPELTLYWRPHDRVQLSSRARVGMLFPYGDDRFRSVPIDHRFYLGGANDMRGWPLRRLAPRVQKCDGVNLDGELVNCSQAPIGGYSEILMNAELRVRMVDELWAAGFLDVGDVRERVADFVPREWQYTTGGGLRYHSPVGIFRLDFGWRLTTDEMRFPEPRRWAIHFSIGEAF